MLPHMRAVDSMPYEKKRRTSSMSNDINIRAYRIFNSFLYIQLCFGKNDIVCVYLYEFDCKQNKTPKKKKNNSHTYHERHR